MVKSLFKHVHFEEIDSTSAYLIRERNKFEDFTFVSADFQSKGKGREVRTWISLKGANLLFSFILKNKDLIKEYSSISLACAASIASLLISKGFKNVKIKWPNDIYINDKKVCGILLQGYFDEYLVVGIGLNVNQESFPDNLHHPATSMYLESNKFYLLSKLREEVFELLFNDLNIKNIREKHYLNVVNSLDYLKGKEVYVDINGKKEKVKVLVVHEDNSLLVSHQGHKISIISGEANFELSNDDSYSSI